MEEQLINFDTAKLAKEKGFDEKSEQSICSEGGGHFYHGGNNSYFDTKYSYEQYSAPTQSFLECWIRRKHGIYGYIDYSSSEAVILDFKNHEGKELLRVDCYNFVVDYETDEELKEELLLASLKLINS